MNDSDAALINRLNAAITGLQWISESDYPLAVVYWSHPFASMTTEQLLQLTNHPLDAIVTQKDLDTFFAVATQPQRWHSATELADVQRYQQVVSTLKQNLTDLGVYCIGSVTIDIYIIGKSQTGAWLGLTTKAVET